MENQNPQSQGELVPVSTGSQMLPASYMPMQVELLHYTPAIYTTIDLSKPENRAMLYDMTIEGGDNSKEWINKEFVIKDIVVHPVAFVSKETGEQVASVRTVILTLDGNVIQFVSQGIYSSLCMMKDCGWMPFGNVPMRFTLKAIPLADGKQFYRLIRVKESPAKKGK